MSNYRGKKKGSYTRVKPPHRYLKLRGKGHNSAIVGTAKTLSQAKKSKVPLIIKTTDWYYENSG